MVQTRFSLALACTRASVIVASDAHTEPKVLSDAQAEAGVLPFVFPFTIPCNQFYNVAPWAPPASIPTPTPGLLAIVNSTPVFADVVLCCGGTISFQWTVGALMFAQGERTKSAVPILRLCITLLRSTVTARLLLYPPATLGAHWLPLANN